MKVTVQNAMKIGKLVECEVVAGHKGIGKIIENVTIMEVPDIVPWLKGNDLLLTSLFSIKDDYEAQHMLIKKLHDSGATALAIKPFHSFGHIPPVILEQADKLNLPVIYIPDHVKYLEILSPVMHLIFDHKVVLQDDLEQATSMLKEITLNSQGIPAFIEGLSVLTKNKITIESPFHFIRIPPSDENISPLSKEEINELSIIKHPIQYIRKLNNEEIPCIVAPVIVDGQLYGNITSWGTNNEHLSMDIAILEKASTLLSIEFLRLKVKYDMEQQYKNDLLRELIFRESINERDFLEWGERYSLSNQTDYLCVLLSDDGKKAPRIDSSMITSKVESILKNQRPNVIVGYLRKMICIILPLQKMDEGSVKKVCREMFLFLKSNGAAELISHMGVGRLHYGLKGIRKSFYEAEKSLKLSQFMKVPREIIFFDDLGAFRLLIPLVENKELEDFYEETIGKLLASDPNHELMDTLKAYFLNNEVLKTTADELFIHVNTLKYRIGRIEAITGCSLRQSEGKVNLFLGLKIHEMFNIK